MSPSAPTLRDDKPRPSATSVGPKPHGAPSGETPEPPALLSGEGMAFQSGQGVGAESPASTEPTQAKALPRAPSEEGQEGEKSKKEATSKPWEATPRQAAAYRCATVYAEILLEKPSLAAAYVHDAKIALDALCKEMPLESAETLLKAAVHGALSSPHNREPGRRLPRVIWAPKAVRALAADHLSSRAEKGGALIEPPPPDPPRSETRVKVAPPVDSEAPQRRAASGPTRAFQGAGDPSPKARPPKPQKRSLMEVQALMVRARALLESGTLNEFDHPQLALYLEALAHDPQSASKFERVKAFCEVFERPTDQSQSGAAPSDGGLTHACL